MKTITKPIAVTAYTDSEGIIRPIGFDIQLKDSEEIKTYKILKVLSCNFNGFSGNKVLLYECEAEIEGKIKKCELKYEKDTCVWKLFRI